MKRPRYQAAVIQAKGANGVTEEYWLRCLPHDFPLVSASPHPELGTPTPGWYLSPQILEQRRIIWNEVVSVNRLPLSRKRPTNDAAVQPVPVHTEHAR